MDPVSAATTFATMVSLLADFVAHRGANESMSFDEFMAWLSETQHQEIRSLLEANSATTISIKAFLNANHQQVIERLQGLDVAMARVASGFEAFRGIAEAAHRESVLSAQAVALLTAFYDSGASKMLLLDNGWDGGKTLILMDANGELEVTDPRFLQDDLDTLADLGFLGVDFNGKGEPLYMLRRVGADAVQAWRASKAG